LGGYRNKLTKLEYHHAFSQTAPRERKVFDYPEPGVGVPLLFHRDTQTPFPLKESKINTSSEKSTQVYKSDRIIPKIADKVISAKPYQSYAEWLVVNNVEEKVMKIQRAVRHWLHRCRVNKLFALQRYLLEDVKRQRIEMLKEQAEKEEKILTDPFPSKRDDFYMMYLMVGKWWQKEWQRICDMKTEAPKKAEFVALLEKEIKLLSAIEKHRIEVKREALKRQQLRFLEMSSRPLTFRNANGQLTTIDDPATQRAREFKEVYTDLVRTDVTPKDRIDFLITLKQLMSNYSAYEYTKDIIKLIDREINLLAIGTKDADLSMLRKRIEQLYMDFLHHPQFNPKVASYRIPNWTKKHDALYKCTRCMKLLPASRYPVHTRMKAYTVCKSCDWLQNVGHQRIDMTPYMRLLKQVQTSEMQKNCYSSVCFVFQQIGMFFLTSVIWHGHSAISEDRDLAKLTHVRWQREVEWSPWNTILLTEEEAECHINIENVGKFYDKVFTEAVRQKHILARIHFTPLLKTDKHLRSTGVWEKITDIVPPPPKVVPLKPQIVFKE
ncbi:IQ and ubiquitin-like domain-containing protein, partial [Macrosteles quadrilineatus]|uniref:IQ and ubiquitin-like domain-containing protein n=1 Tax=Macrosteles quadrilineatus TaxID=74068 RepID=UPI0023E1CB48